MKNKIKAIILFVTGIITAITLVLTGLNTNVKADEVTSTPELSIDYANLNYGEKIDIMLAVKLDNVTNASDVKILEWNEPKTEYTNGSEMYSTSYSTTATILENTYNVFYSEGIAPKNIVDNYYFRAYVKVGETEYYSDVLKYSVLEYLTMGKKSTSFTADQKEVFTSTLEYGAAIQKMLNYKTDFLATDEMCVVNLVGAKLDDGFSKGIYKKNSTVTSTSTDGDGKYGIKMWIENDGSVLSYDPELTVTEDVTAYPVFDNLKYEYDEWTYSYSVKAKDKNITSAYITQVFFGDANITIEDEAFYQCTNLKKVTIEVGVTSIGSSAFKDCTNLKKVTIEEGVTSIGADVFYGCSNLTSITIPNSVTSIGYQAFYGCSNLTSITIPNSVTSIGDSAFYGCSNLTSITIPESVTYIGYDAFVACYKLVEVYNLSTSFTIEKGSDDNSCLGQYAKVIHTSNSEPSRLKISNNGVYYAYEDEKIFIRPTDLKVTTITIDSDCKEIASYAFSKCTSLTNITIPNSVTSIGYQAFYGCSNLTSITIPNSVTSIGDYAFYGCSNLTSITIPESVTYIGFGAFVQCHSLASIVVAEGNTVYDSRNNCNAIIETNTNKLITGCKNTFIPNDITSIGQSAFENCTGLISIVIPSSVTSIGTSAFNHCINLTSIIIYSSQLSIADNAFLSCTNLASIYYYEKAIDISISYSNSAFEEATKYYYSEDKPTSEGNYWHYDSNNNIVIWPKNNNEE